MVFIFFSISLTIFLLIIVANYFSQIVLTAKPMMDHSDLISVLIPARNEEGNIRQCIRSLSLQSYKNIEIIVLDDDSTDNTLNILISCSSEFPNLKVIRGYPLPNSWNGKNWACHQLSLNASGKYLLFIDADVTLSSHAVASSLNYLKYVNLDLLTIFSTQEIRSVGEMLIVPIMHWFLLSTLPLTLVRSRIKSFVAANGQFMLWDIECYKSIGGHKTVSNNIVEDMELIRLVKKHNYKPSVLLGGDIVKCRMYTDFKTAFHGFAKNLYPGFNLSPFSFLTVLLSLFLIFTAPFILWVYSSSYLYLVALILLGRLLISLKSSQKILPNLLLHPLQMVLFLLIGLYSLILFKSKKLKWKGRNL